MIKLYFSVLVLSLAIACKKKDPVLFKQIPSSESGITFNNSINENEMLNMINYQYLYNGGGVGIGDFNNDSLPDIYFTASLQPNKLYLNRGNMKFEDITTLAGVEGEKKWCRGVSVVDINNDGLLDMYVAAAAWQSPELKKDILYVNQGLNESGIPRFKNLADEYGLVDTVSTHMSAFFDYDNDGDLDLYVVVNDLNQEYPSTFRKIRNDGSGFTNDILYRNDWDEQLQQPRFTNVSKEAGITWEGNGLGISILDINQDGWKDIYVSNDYLSGNLLYINNKNGTFTNMNDAYFKHGSLNAMGNDAGDINNDGLLDIVEMDMMPEDNYRQKMMMNPVDYNWYIYSEKYGFPYQTVRNTLQLNQGNIAMENDSIGHPVFSDIAYAAGVAHTDWSWAALLTDVDNDGYKDLMTTNGLPKDVTDLDFIAYREQGTAKSLFDLMQKLPPVHISNYIYRNNRDLSFADKTKEWGWNFPTYSAGIGYADFDRDGDLDVIINNTNMEASLLKNNRNEFKQPNHYIRFSVRGSVNNIQGIGTTIKIYYKNQIQVAEHTPYHGYMSSMEPVIHFGLDTAQAIDSVVILWPDQKRETLTGLKIDQTHYIGRSTKATPFNYENSAVNNSSWFINQSVNAGISFIHDETDYPDFNFQRQIPHKLSQFGPVLASGDLDGDGLTDIIIGGSAPNPSFIFRQSSNQKFMNVNLNPAGFIQSGDDGAICVFDADRDNDKDILITTSWFSSPGMPRPPKDRIYVNDGTGNFLLDTTSLPYLDSLAFPKTTVKAYDYDKDGDEDLFMGERGIPGRYPAPVSGHVWRNDSKAGKIKFTDITSEIAPALKNIGLITDMIWTDTDKDGDADMVITGEWMGIHLFINDKGKFNELNTPLKNLTGWWNCINQGDIDGDGDIDFAMGNYGTNGIYQVNEQQPASVYAGDLDGNKRWDLMMGMWKPEVPHGVKKEFPVAYRDQIAEETPSIKKKYDIYKGFAQADLATVLNLYPNKPSVQKKAIEFRSGWIENKGNNSFEFHPFPVQAQWAPVNAILIGDFNHDKQSDIILTGNDYTMHPYIGRYDAMNGLVLKGTNSKTFVPLSITESGFFMPGHGRSMIQIPYGNSSAIAVAQNRGRMKFYVIK